ncbi:MAG: tRNA uridine-5-carboxymethylaminomethyl(34) synthesis GTPase MnmE [Ignavibacteriaceae bacterium]
MLNEDTITAIATPQGVGAIAVIRVSGPRTFEVIDKIFRGRKKIAEANSHTIHYGFIEEADTRLDDVLISVFRAPNSYTGEDVAEISSHGNPLIAKKIIELLTRHSIRLAEPGEFTKRAFLNNRIDLAQAEAVVDVIASRTEASLRGARNQLDGLLSSKIDELRNSLINVSSFVELELDFAEEDIELIDNSELQNEIELVLTEVEGLISSYTYGKVLKDGVNVAIVGKPNVGKSSLLNYILKESRAIVSAIPGTTRDVIREDVSIDGYWYRLFDTAGIRASEDEIEVEGVLRSREVVKNADIILLVHDVEQGVDINFSDEIKTINSHGKLISVLNKTDLHYSEEIEADVKISAKTGQGIDKLFNILKAAALGNSSYSERTAIITSLRHYNSLVEARSHLNDALTSIRQKMSGEFIAADLRSAENSLAEILGVVSTDDILNNIFHNFCIGK